MWNRTPMAGGSNMSGFMLNRRRFLSSAAVGASSLVLAGCDQFDFLGQRDNPTRDFLERANSLTYQVQRAIAGTQSLAREYTESEILQGQRPNGSTNPDTPDYVALAANQFRDYRL